jgi:hypothetical protein
MPALFPYGEVVATAGALDVLTEDETLSMLHRHLSGDWGDIDAEDTNLNERALMVGTRLLSRYKLDKGVFYVITEADRSVTTVLRAEDY